MGLLGEVLLITAAAGIGGTGAGGLIACLFRRDSSRAVSLLLSFAAGVMTAVVCFDLLADAVSPGAGRLWLTVSGILLGCAVTGVLNVWIGRRSGPGGGLFLAGLVMATAIALHNVPEGMVIGASFAREAARPARSGLVMAAVIGLHNIPEGMSIATPLLAGGGRPAGAIGIAALSGLPTILGALAGYGAGEMNPLLLAVSLSFAAGAMLYVIFGELLPESEQLWQSRLSGLSTMLGMLLGMALIFTHIH